MNLLTLYIGHLRSSKRILILSSIGLICALTIFSSTAYYVDNSKQQIVDDFIGNYKRNSRSFDLSIHLSNDDLIRNLTSSFMPIFEQTKAEFNIKSFNEMTAFEQISQLWGEGLDFSPINKIPQFTNKSVAVYQLTPTLEKELKMLQDENGALLKSSIIPSPSNSFNEVYLLSNFPFNSIGNLTNPYNLSESGASFKIYDSLSTTKANSFNVSVLGISSFKIDVQYDDYGFAYSTTSSLKKYSTLSLYREMGYSDILMFTPDLNKFGGLLNQTIGSNQSFNSLSRNSYFGIALDWKQIDVYNTDTTIDQIDKFIEKLTSNFYDSTLYNDNSNIQEFSVFFESLWMLQSIQGLTNNIIYGLLMISLPVLIITIFVTNYSFGLIYKHTVGQIGIFKTRGATSGMILAFQVIDSVLVIILSIGAGIITGVPLTYLILKTDFLLSFNYPDLKNYIFNYQAIGSFVLYSAIIISFLTNYSRIKKLSRMTVIETENPIEATEPAWKSHYWDVILFSYGMLFYVLLYSISRNPSILTSLGALLGIIFILAIPSPFALIIGLILICNRFIPTILNRIGTWLWVRNGGLLAFAFKNVIRHQQASTRAIMLMATLLAFVISFYSIPFTGLIYNEQVLYYQNGAEGTGTLSFTNYYNQTDLTTLSSNFSQYLEGFSPYMVLSSQVFKLMLINTSTYLSAAYTNFDFGIHQHSLPSLMKDLTITDINDGTIPVAVDEYFISQGQYEINGNISVFSVSKKSKPQKFSIVDTFKNWPKAKINSWNQKVAVADIGYYTQILNQSRIQLQNSSFSFAEGGVFFNFKQGVDQKKILEWIEGNTSLKGGLLVEEKQNEYLNGVSRRLQLGQINNNVIMTFVISLIVLIMFSYLQLTERKREIYTERALGMKLRQISVLFFTETIVLMLTAVILGTILGVFLMELLSLFITQSRTFPPLTIILPIKLIAITNFTLIGLSVLASFIPAFFVSRHDISKGFAGET